ncbi:pyridoxal phosphate-dependent aminotransferase [Burkholderia sp. MR1-5-21]
MFVFNKLIEAYMNSEWLSERVNSIKASPSVAANALVGKLREAGRDIANLTVGEPDFDTPDHIIEAAIDALRSGDTHYTATAGTLALRRAIVTKLARDNGLQYTPDEIVAGCGGKHIIAHAFNATLNSGDEVIVHAPYWVSYPDLAILNGGVPVVINGNDATAFKLQPDELEAAITPRTKWVVLNSPNNPSGAVYSADELAALAVVLKRHPHVLIMADEIYEHYVYDGTRHVSLLKVAPDLKDRTLTVNGASKGYAMTGWRLGYGAGPVTLISAIAKLLSQTTTCATAVSQAAAVAAFAGEQEPVEVMRRAYEGRRALIADALSGIPGMAFAKPEGAFYVFANVSGLIGKRTPAGQMIRSDIELAEYLLVDGGVATVCGAAYGLSPYLRISFASSEEEIVEGCQRIRAACSALL